MSINDYSILIAHRQCSTGSCAIRARFPVLLLLLIVSASFTVSAADLKVRVFERGGKAPLTGASICLGTPANLSQFGAYLTDAEGYVVFRDVPGASLVVTVSKSGYMGEQQSLVTSNVERMLVLSLPTGGGGTRCNTGARSNETGSSGLQIRYLRINQGAAVSTSRDILLKNNAHGHPNQYRASEHPDFNGARWESYSTEPVFKLSSGDGRKMVYFQVRRYSELGGADIQILSPVVHDSINLQLP
jgi:hypothetical protein